MRCGTRCLASVAIWAVPAGLLPIACAASDGKRAESRELGPRYLGQARGQAGQDAASGNGATLASAEEEEDG